ncbi:hypothetical protein D3C72_1139540 [compost metagenome]
MTVIGQGGVGLCITVQVVDETIKQLVRGVEIQLLGIARIALLERCPQTTHPRRQTFLVGAQHHDQTRRIGAGQGTTAEAVEQLGEVLQTRLDGRHHGVRRAAAQAFEQLVQGIEARGDAHELTVQATEPAIAPTHVRVFKNSHAAQAFQAHGFGDETHVAGLERLPLTATAQAVGDEQGEHTKTLIQGIAHRRASRLRQDGGTDQGRTENAQRDFQHPPDRRHERPLRMGQRGQADHRRGVSSEDETVGAEVAAAGGAGRADTDPDRQRTEE